MLPDTAAQNPDKPWAHRARAIPLQTWSGRVVYEKPKKTWTTRDAQRVLAALIPPASAPPDDWARGIIKMLRAASKHMLGYMLFWLPSDVINEIYQWAIELLDKFFGIQENIDEQKAYAKSVILYIAQRAGIAISFE
jgi:hypothetical protein